MTDRIPRRLSFSGVYLYLVLAALLMYAIQDIASQYLSDGLSLESRTATRYSQIVVAVLLMTYYSFSFLTRPVLSTIMLPLLLILIWNAFVDAVQQDFSWTVFMRLGVSALWFLIFFYFRNSVRYRPDSLKHIGWGMAAMFLLYALASVYASYLIYSATGRLFQHNVVYYVITFMPWIFLLKNQWLRNVSICAVLVITVLSMKRGAIVALPLMIGCALVVESIVDIRRSKKIIVYIALAVVFVITSYVVNKYSNEFLTERFTYEELEHGSGRSRLFAETWEGIRKRDTVDFLLGSGSGTSMEYLSVGGGAHNEWLEFLFCHGLLGVLFYALLVYALLRKLSRLIRTRSFYATAYCSAIVYFVVVGLYGMIYYTHSTMFLMAFFGAVDGLSFHPTRNGNDCLNCGA